MNLSRKVPTHFTGTNINPLKLTIMNIKEKKIEKSIEILHNEISNLGEFYSDDDVRKILGTFICIDLSTITDEFVDAIWDRPIRRCTYCGELMEDGYLLGEDYACSDKCRNELYKKWHNLTTDEEAERQYNKDYENTDDFFYTQWY